jgi:excisionase family DNA binding protein
MSDVLPEKDWLGLGETAQLLGIHPVTLRRWADAGEISFMTTAGGHRRFAIVDVKRFAAERQHLSLMPRVEQVWADQALVKSHEVVLSHRNARWMEVFGEQDRERSRVLGRRLMAIVMQYISSDESPDILLDEARAIGVQYALSSIEHGLSMTTVLEAMMSFRDAMFESAILVPEVTHSAMTNSARLLKRINTLLNAVQLAVAQTYDQTLRT